MHVTQLKNSKTGRVFLGYAVTYRDPVLKKNVQKIVQKIGYLDEFTSKYKDPLQHFKNEAKRLTKEEKDKIETLTISFSSDEKIEDHGAADRNRKNLGSAAICKVYHELEIDYFIKNRQRYSKREFNHESIFRLLTYERILSPSKTNRLSAWNNRGSYFEKFDFPLESVYRALDFYAKYDRDMLLHLHKRMMKTHGRKPGLMYYDVTNYYSEIDDNDPTLVEYVLQAASDKLEGLTPLGKKTLRAKGVSKEHRPNPIIQLGLYMDSNGFPVTYDIFRGNTNDCLTFKPMFQSIRDDFDIRETIQVADKGMMTGDNVAEIILSHQGYIISHSVRRANLQFKKYILDETGYIYAKEEADFKYKERFCPRIIRVTSNELTKNGNNKKEYAVINERQIVFWSKKYQEKARKERAEAVDKAKKKVATSKDGATNQNSYGSSKYLKEKIYNFYTGEVVELNSKNSEFLTFLDFDDQKLENEELLDGYYVICSNVVGRDYDEEPFEGWARYHKKDNFFQVNEPISTWDIIQKYRGLWQIEESFKITKSTLSTRPAFVSLDDHLRAHFLTCFVSLLILRIIEKEVFKDSVSADKITKELFKAQGTRLPQGWFLFDYEDPEQILKKIGESYGIDFSLRTRSPKSLRTLFGDMKKN